jgi:hypothetical protein
MPRYKVLKQGFYNGMLYDPEGKRPVLDTDEPLKPLPSWVEPMKAETAAAKKKRLAAEKKAADAAKKKSADDEKDIADASFMGEGENTTGSVVETI